MHKCKRLLTCLIVVWLGRQGGRHLFRYVWIFTDWPLSAFTGQSGNPHDLVEYLAMDAYLQKLHFGSLLPHFFLPFAQILALSLPPFTGRSEIFVPSIAALAFLSYTNLVTEDHTCRLAMLNQWWIFLATVEKLLFSNVEEDYYRKDRAKAEALSMSLGVEKIKWALSLLTNPRGIGWNFEVKGVPAADKPLSRRKFLRYQLSNYIKYFVITDLIHVYAVRQMHVSGVEPSLLTIRSNTWSGSLLNAVFAGLKIYFPLQLAYTAGSIVTVLLNLSDLVVRVATFYFSSQPTFSRTGLLCSETLKMSPQYAGSGANSGIR